MGQHTVESIDDNFSNEVLESATTVLVDFGPLRGPVANSPLIDQLAEEYSGKVKVGKVNRSTTTQA
ncbi:MAG: hypothetical protein U0930_11985 [Pirellulales bacterium]